MNEGKEQTHKIVSGSVVLAALSGLPAIALGQTQEVTPLEEIVVTATRIEKPITRVPAAISVVGQDAIQLGRQQLAIDESLSRVPGVFMQDRYNFAQDVRVSIRGFGARAQFGIRGVKIVVDGIPETLPDGQGNLNTIDLGATSQIEVLRGPSSSLWGNASGGVISVTSERAPSDRFMEVRATAGEFDFQKVQFKTGAQGDNVGYLFAVSDSTYDGYREQSKAEKTQLTGRFNFDLGDDRELIGVVSYTDQPTTEDPGGITAAQVAMDRRSARDLNIQYNAGETIEQTRVGLVYNMPVAGDDEFSARIYYATRDFNNFLPFVGGGSVDLQRTFSGGGVNYTLDGRLGGMENTAIFGIDFDHQDDDRLRYDNMFGVRGPLAFDQNETVRSQGLFAQDDLDLSDKVTLSFGARWDQVEFDVTDRFLSDGNDSGQVTVDDVSPMVGVSVDLSATANFYATYSTAFETPTTTEFNRPDGAGGFNDALKPQFARNYEIGVRTMLGQRSRAEISVYHVKVDDELIPFEVPTSPGRDYYENAGKSSRRGVEFSIVADPTDRVSTTLSYTYGDYKFDQFVDANGNDYSGNQIPGTARSVLFAEITYKHPRGWFVSLDGIHISEQSANNANTTISPGYTVSNLRLGWNVDAGNTAISPFLGVNNLFDETYTDNLRINAFGGRYYEPAPDRNIYAGVTVRFNR